MDPEMNINTTVAFRVTMGALSQNSRFSFRKSEETRAMTCSPKQTPSREVAVRCDSFPNVRRNFISFANRYQTLFYSILTSPFKIYNYITGMLQINHNPGETAVTKKATLRNGHCANRPPYFQIECKFLEACWPKAGDSNPSSQCLMRN